MARDRRDREDKIETVWVPKTELGQQVLAGSITDIEDVLSKGVKILEQEVVDRLAPDLESDLLLIGQSKGKFGGGQRRAFRQTQKKTREGNKPKFTTFAVVGNKNGLIGVGRGSSKETVPAREKAFRQAKLNLIRIPRGFVAPDLIQGNPHTIPFTVRGKCGSCEVELIPAPRGTGLVVEKECAKILKLAGIKDVYSKSFGKTKTRLNNLKACFDALQKLSKVKVKESDIERLQIVYGRIGKSE
ncbi:MAG: 30S ribosomal protein S5 [Candidatus Woesearchaeota archaeon]